MRAAAVVAKLELLQPEHRTAGAACQPVRRSTAQPAQPQHDVLKFFLQHAGIIGDLAQRAHWQPTHR